MNDEDVATPGVSVVDDDVRVGSGAADDLGGGGLVRGDGGVAVQAGSGAVGVPDDSVTASADGVESVEAGSAVESVPAPADEAVVAGETAEADPTDGPAEVVAGDAVAAVSAPADEPGEAVAAGEAVEADPTPADWPTEAGTVIAGEAVAVDSAPADRPAEVPPVAETVVDEPAPMGVTSAEAVTGEDPAASTDTFLTSEAMEFFTVPAASAARVAPTVPAAPTADAPAAKTFGVPEIFRASEATQFIVAPKPGEQVELFELPKVVREDDDTDTVVFAGVLDLDDLAEPPAKPPQATVEPPRPTREKNSPAVLTGVFAMILCSVLGLGLISGMGNAKPIEGHAVAAPFTAALAPASAEPVRPRAVQRLEDHPLLVTPKSLPQIACDLPAFGSSDRQLADYYAAGVLCLDNAWGPVLKDANLPFEPPELDAAPELSDGPCGAAPASEDAVAYYCGRNRMIYMPTSRLRENGGGDRPATHLATLAHEYGHHVQAMTGMLRAADLKIVNAGEKTPAGLEMSRRIELQANCFAGMFLGAVAGKGSISDELAGRAEEDFQYAMEEAPEKNAHGSPANQGNWALSGFEANATDACNTYAAPSSEVG